MICNQMKNLTWNVMNNLLQWLLGDEGWLINSSSPQWHIHASVNQACIGPDNGLSPGRPLSEPMLTYCHLDSWEHISVKLELEFYHFHSRKCHWKCRLLKWRPFCPGGDEWSIYHMLIFSVLSHWNENVFILMKSSSLAAPKVVKMTTFGAASDETFIKMMTFSFQWHAWYWHGSVWDSTIISEQTNISRCIFMNENVCILILN